ncbi:hypothetical protein ACGFWF_01310 [Streptomyces sp. NPDC048581]|uniref:hypothetical protein n=1 Tax=Streptomyces sp. NPDC048581 TaxID=3365572 RepID=UPI003711DAFB
MDAVRVALLREVLAGTEWLGQTRRFAGALRASAVAHGGGLLLVGTPEYEPWHLAAHLVDEAAWSGTPELTPTLVRHDARASDPAHLAVGLGRLAAARRGETLLVVSPWESPGSIESEGGGGPGAPLLERVHDARRAGATVLTLGAGEGELRAMAHETLAVPEGSELDLDTVQHLVSAAAGENAVPSGRRRRRFRDRLSRLAESLTAPPPARW